MPDGGSSVLAGRFTLVLVEVAGAVLFREMLPAFRGGPLPSLPAGLTPREAEVLALIAAGMSNNEIADDLAIGEGTVKSHINHLLTKIDARDRAQAVTVACQHGLTQPRDSPAETSHVVLEPQTRGPAAGPRSLREGSAAPGS